MSTYPGGVRRHESAAGLDHPALAGDEHGQMSI